MCGHCHRGWSHCDDWDYPRYYGSGARYYSYEPAPEDKREYLEEEKRILERRLKDIEARIGEITK